VVRAPHPLVVLALLAAALPARGEEPPAARGPFVGVYAGFATPHGDVARSGPRLEDLVDYKVPLGLGLGYRFNRRIWGELFVELAPGSADSALCAGGVECSASNFRTGLAFLLRLAPRARLDPWIGVGAGIEVLNVEGRNVAAGGAAYEWSWFGIELPIVEAGVDVTVSERFSVGPFASATVARFTSESARAIGGATDSGEVPGRRTHGWLSAGIKATLRL
jgi:hypothetical protein